MNKKGLKEDQEFDQLGQRRFIWRGIYVEWTGGTEAYIFRQCQAYTWSLGSEINRAMTINDKKTREHLSLE